MIQKVDISQAFIKGVAVSGIAFVWVNFTLKTFKMACHIISTSPDLTPQPANVAPQPVNIATQKRGGIYNMD